MENSPAYILDAISAGFDVEIDCWVIENNIFLGHDNPQYQINFNFLQLNKDRLWIHCKNLNAMEFFINKDFNFFWHENDQYTLTSNKYIWTYPLKKYSKNSILVDLDLNYLKLQTKIPYGVCTDYPKKALTFFN